MKKVILLPKTDTVILCLPEKWVGIPLICKLEPMETFFLNGDEMEEKRMITFRNHKRKTKRKLILR